ncbi:MAG: molybdopterin molybdotransferase MoeA [Proteobacteria bacterium]|nr:MAG: molybdopterin molybdotransferase MoeA [Pseudomonadota bacterium]
MQNDVVRAQPSCEDDYDPASLTCDEALERILETVSAVTDTETLAVRDALGRVLAEPVISAIDVPSHTNSAMDGYAVRADDLPHRGTKRLKIMGNAFAGKPYRGQVGRNQTIRIMTGAVVPPETNIVIMQEQVETDGHHITIDGRHKIGQNVRAAGEDMVAGSVVLRSGRIIGPAELGLVASLGIGELSVKRRPRVAFFSTGDELRGVGEKLNIGEIYDSNRYTLHGMLRRLGADIIDMGVVRDERDAVDSALVQAAASADVVITSGGVSVGEADYIKEVLTEIGTIRFWKVAMKPGRPLAFGTIDGSVFFGLPGNPVSVMVTFYQFVQPALLAIMGAEQQPQLLIKALAANALKKRPGRVEYQRGFLSTNEAGELIVATAADQGSGILSSMSNANCFVVLPMASGHIEAGSPVEVQPFFGIM